MDERFRGRFVSLWAKYFGDADLPIAIFFSDEEPAEGLTSTKGGQCIVELLPLAMKGKTLCFSSESRICGGARRYLGFTEEIIMPDFEYFLSYGVPGRLKGERYKKSPELVRDSMKFCPSFKAPNEFMIMRRWDKLAPGEEPEVVVFLADIDTISGLFTLANFDEADPSAVICPFGSGCSSIVYHPYRELQSLRPRCILGMFDISARPYVGKNSLSFAVPYPKFKRMVENMPESFLTTGSWKALGSRRSVR